MGKGDLWDDSALIDAFDDAMTTYKVMHGKKHHGDSPMESNNIDGNDAQDTLLTEKINGLTELEVNDSNLTNSSMEMPVPNTEEASEGLPVEKRNLGVNLQRPESETPTSGFDIGDKVEQYSDQQIAHYNELLRQYYELEEQKEKIAQQLQASYWNYQTSAQSTTYQADQDPSVDASQHGFQPVCSVTAPSVPACTIGGVSSAGCCCCSAYMTCCSASRGGYYPGGPQCSTESGICSIGTSCMVNSMKQSTPEDDSVVKMGMLAAEKAISSMQKELSASSSNGGEKTNGKATEDVSGIGGGNGSQNINSDTNLSAVLGAWYAAGFQTGRYLMEQSKSNRSQ